MGEDWIELNATRRETVINPISRGQEILIVIGEGSVEKSSSKIFSRSGK